MKLNIVLVCIHNTASFIVDVTSFFVQIQYSVVEEWFAKTIRRQSRFDKQIAITNKAVG